MPIPIENIRRMSTITIPKQDIHFDTYDFQFCQPQDDIKGAFESRELEATFCRDFACCGLILEDLHDLLQHYEECHIRLEEDLEESEDDFSEPSSPILEDMMALKKKQAAAYLSDLYNEEFVGKKRPFQEEEEVEEPPNKKLNMFNKDFITQALLTTTNNEDKPYKCSIKGCDKAYKNPNGLKYHNQHGHCSNLLNEDESEKPYQCTIGDCNKRYKNLNGLKYHIEHSHMVALNHTLASFSNSLLL